MRGTLAPQSAALPVFWGAVLGLTCAGSVGADAPAARPLRSPADDSKLLPIGFGIGVLPPRLPAAPQLVGGLLAVGRNAKDREAVRMGLALATGSRMGPGEGWFGPSQSRFHWAWLVELHGSPKQKTIGSSEFLGEAEWFAALDRDGNGKLSADDFDWSEKSKFLQAAAPAERCFRQFDGDSNGRVTAEEWSQLYAQLAGAKGFVTAQDLARRFAATGGKEERLNPLKIVKGFLAQELGSFREGPVVGDQAPDFALKTVDNASTVRLSSFLGKLPVVLIFGSFT
jgi:hypothetical protein